MESVVRNVKDIDQQERDYLQSVLGQDLSENQQVMILVLDPGVVPDDETRGSALDAIRRISAEGARNLAEQGVPADEVDTVLDEALEAVRSRRRS
ncbi:MAG: hypothetical protein WD069_17260 [Planctomycetales bacterium]